MKIIHERETQRQKIKKKQQKKANKTEKNKVEGGGGAEVIVKGSELNDFVVHQFHLFITHLVTDFIIIM